MTIKRKLYEPSQIKNPTNLINNRFLLQNSLKFEEDGKFIEELEANMSKIETNKDYLKSMYNMLFKKDKLIDRKIQRLKELNSQRKQEIENLNKNSNKLDLRKNNGNEKNKIFMFESGKIQQNLCSFCQKEFFNGEKIINLACEHKIHSECQNKVLEKKCFICINK